MPKATAKRLANLWSLATQDPPKGLARACALGAMRLFEVMTDVAWTRPRSIFYGYFLDADAIRIGGKPRVRGRRSIHIGDQFVALDGLWLEAIDYLEGYAGSIVIGSRVTCGDLVHIAATNLVHLGDDVLIGSRVTITDHNHGIYHGEGQSSPLQTPRDRVLSKESRTVVQDRVWLGDGVVLLAGSYVGHGSVIGANSVVRGYIPPDSIAVGNPAKVIRTFSPEEKGWLPRRD